MNEYGGQVDFSGKRPEWVLLTLADGYQAQARWFASEAGHYPVLYLHGIQSHGGWFLKSCAHLHGQGFSVLLAERRGSGVNQTDRGHADSAEQLIDDVDVGVEWLRQRTGKERVHLVGVSWSGKLVLAYAAKHPEKVRSIVLVAPGLRALVDISLAEKIRVGMSGLLNPKKQYLIPLEDPHLFTENPEMIRFIENDPLKLTKATASFFLAGRKIDAAGPKIVDTLAGLQKQRPLPVYLFLAEHDRIIDNTATLELLRPILTAHKIYPGAHHTLDFEPDPSMFFTDLTKVLQDTE
ncbi:MAG: alpha/beta fold hydrolase [Sedimentisphaerales bacterium]|nr:alpha/beta fold hydrolase [Sedimentisphaerales bacterium]